MNTEALSEQDHICASLDALLAAICEHDAQPKPRRDDGLKVYSLADLEREMEEDAKRTRYELFAHRLRDEPVRYALKQSVRRLGKRLHEIGGLDAMRAACDSVADMDESRWSYRTSIMDTAWDGIGDDEQGHWIS